MQGKTFNGTFTHLTNTPTRQGPRQLVMLGMIRTGPSTIIFSRIRLGLTQKLETNEDGNSFEMLCTIIPLAPREWQPSHKKL